MKLRSRIGHLGLVLFTELCLAAWMGDVVIADDIPGAVYTLSNEASGNQLVIFHRHNDGSLSLAGTVATGGEGLGSGPASQGSLIAGRGGRVLYAVNAGSNNLTAFKIHKNTAQVKQILASGGASTHQLDRSGRRCFTFSITARPSEASIKSRDSGSTAILIGSLFCRVRRRV